MSLERDAKDQQGKSGDMAFVAIELPKTPGGLSVTQQINNLIAAVRDSCEQFKSNNIPGMWVMAWREYGLIESGDIVIPDEAINELIKAMQQFTKKYPQLVIFAGSIASIEHLHKDQEILAEIEKRYADIRWVEGRMGGGELESHRQKFFEQKEAASNVISVLQNYTLVFQAGKIIKKHYKTIPFQETGTSKLAGLVFEPGSSDDDNFYFDLIDPITKTKRTAGLELCVEHIAGALRNKKPHEKVDVQIVLSFGAELNPVNCLGVHTFGIDSSRAPTYMTSFVDSDNIVFYRYDMARKLLSKASDRHVHPFQCALDSEYIMVDSVTGPPSAFSRTNNFLGMCDETFVAEHREMIGAVTVGKKTALHAAVERSHSNAFQNRSNYKKLIGIFIKYGADVNAQDERGDTPLHQAAFNSNVYATQQLMEHKADCLLKNKSGKSPLSIAIKKKSWEELVYMLIAMKDCDDPAIKNLREHRPKLTNAFIQVMKMKEDKADRRRIINETILGENALGKIFAERSHELTKPFLHSKSKYTKDGITPSISSIIAQFGLDLDVDSKENASSNIAPTEVRNHLKKKNPS
ncbi:MAG: ankyrin repeat domain-containing protein [Gammaproteobacteria bacterium]